MGVPILRMHMVVGNPKARSRTWEVASEVVRQVAERAKAYGFTVEEAQEDLALLGSELVQWPSLSVEEALGSISEADLLVVASPTFKASYSGLLKMFLDRMPPRFLCGKSVVPVMVGASPYHGLAVDVYLRPVLVELGAVCSTPGLYVLESQIAHLSEVVSSWLEHASIGLEECLRRKSVSG